MSQSTVKTLMLLELIAEGCRTLPELARASQMPKSTAHRLITVLVGGGYVKQENREYYLGFKLLELGELMKQDLRLVPTARPHMQQLANNTSESVHLGELDGSYVVYIEKIEGKRGLRMASRVGLRSPAQTTAMGKVLLAQLEREDAERRLVDLVPRTENTITEKHTILDELSIVRDAGYALDREENEVGIRCIAAPIWNADGRVVAALSLSGATQYITPERQEELVPLVVRCAGEISRDCGGGQFVIQHEFPKESARSG